MPPRFAGSLSRCSRRRRRQTWSVPGFDFRHLEYNRLINYYRSLFGPDAETAELIGVDLGAFGWML
jgi:hypothetical protein